MKYLDLNTLTTASVLGHWKVLDRFANRTDANAIFVKVDYLDFIDGQNFRAGKSPEITGTWTFTREQEVIYNPQLTFFEGQEEIGSAIITRLSTSEPEPEPTLTLTLYFNTGLELVLEKPAG